MSYSLNRRRFGLKSVAAGISIAFLLLGLNSFRNTPMTLDARRSGLDTLLSKQVVYHSYSEALSNPWAVVNLEIKNPCDLGSEIGCLKNLETLSIQLYNPEKSLPDELFELNKLKVLHINGGPSLKIDSRIAKLRNLEVLEVSGALPKEVQALTRLKTIVAKSLEQGSDFSLMPSLSNVQFSQFDSSVFSRVSQVSSLTFTRTGKLFIGTIPSSITSMKNLRAFSISEIVMSSKDLKNAINYLGSLPSLKELNLDYHLSDSSQALLAMESGMFPKLHKICILSSKTNCNFFSKFKSIDSLEISFFEKGNYLIKDSVAFKRALLNWDATMGFSNLKSLKLNFIFQNYSGVKNLFGKIARQKSLGCLCISGLIVDDTTANQWSWMKNLKRLTRLKFEYCRNVPLRHVFKEIRPSNNSLNLIINSCEWDSVLEINVKNTHINSITAFQNTYLPEISMQSLTSLSYLETDLVNMLYDSCNGLDSIVYHKNEGSSSIFDDMELYEVVAPAKLKVIYEPEMSIDITTPEKIIPGWKPNEMKYASEELEPVKTIDSTKDGFKVLWYESGLKKYEHHYVNGSAVITSWFDNGVKETYSMSYPYPDNNKIMCEIIISWNSLGDLQGYSCFCDSKPEGKQIVFYPNGRIQSVINYKMGTKSGLSKFWDENGKLKTENNY